MTDYRFVEAHKASVGALFALASEAFAGVEQLAALNLQAIKTTLVEFERGIEAALAAKSPAAPVRSARRSITRSPDPPPPAATAES